MRRNSLDRAGRCVRFYESHAPLPWLRLILWGLPVAMVVFGWLAGRSDGRVWVAVGLAVMFLVGAASLEISLVLYGGVCIDESQLRVGRMRQVALADLDLDSLRFEAAWEIYEVFGKRNVKSNPMWLPQTVALEGHDERGKISVIVKTARRDELVGALRAAEARAGRF